jgi:hypothetical protein
MKHITVIITHRDDNQNLEKCLKSVKETGDDFLVIDLTGSNLVYNICHSQKIKYVRNEPDEITSFIDEKGNPIPDSYILSLGSNEYLSGGSKNHIKMHKSIMTSDAYKLVIRKNYYGRWMKHSGLYPNLETRIYRRDLVNWNGNSVKLKPGAEMSARIDACPGEMYCVVYRSIFEHINQINQTTETEAQMLFNSGLGSNIFKILFRPWVRFFHLFFIKLGFLDGYYGLVNAVISSYYEFLVEVKLKFFRRMD